MTCAKCGSKGRKLYLINWNGRTTLVCKHCKAEINKKPEAGPAVLRWPLMNK